MAPPAAIVAGSTGSLLTMWAVPRVLAPVGGIDLLVNLLVGVFVGALIVAEFS